MATKRFVEVRNVSLRDFRGRFMHLLGVRLGSHRHWITQPEEIGLELDIEELTKVIKDSLGLESVEATEIVTEAIDILNNSKITAEVGGSNRHLLVVKIVFPKTEPKELETTAVPGGGVNHDLSENPDA